jgi:hypothetical protein
MVNLTMKVLGHAPIRVHIHPEGEPILFGHVAFSASGVHLLLVERQSLDNSSGLITIGSHGSTLLEKMVNRKQLSLFKSTMIISESKAKVPCFIGLLVHIMTVYSWHKNIGCRRTSEDGIPLRNFPYLTARRKPLWTFSGKGT